MKNIQLNAALFATLFLMTFVILEVTSNATALGVFS